MARVAAVAALLVACVAAVASTAFAAGTAPEGACARVCAVPVVCAGCVHVGCARGVWGVSRCRWPL